MQPIIPLKGTVQHYDWGGSDFIALLLSQSNPEQRPFAELWMGTHKNGTATALLAQQEISLKKLIEQSPETILGPEVTAYFEGRLPFLFKILDVRKMLSIQAHPTKSSALEGFRLENEKGVPLDAKHRNYKDDNHKPEVMVALTDFWLLHGFRSEEAIAEVLAEVAEFKPLRPHFEERNIKALYQFVMEMPQAQVDQILHPLRERLEKQTLEGPLAKSSPDYWALQGFQDYTRDGHYDRGIFSIYLFNLVFIPKGQGIFQAAGIPHAYLEGVNVELMANSDNVFRGGLTPKHIDVPGLMQHLVFDPIDPAVFQGEQQNEIETYFPTPAPDFALWKFAFNEANGLLAKEAQDTAFIYIVMKGQIVVSAGEAELAAKQGDIFMIPAGQTIEIKSSGDSLLFGARAGEIPI